MGARRNRLALGGSGLIEPKERRDSVADLVALKAQLEQAKGWRGDASRAAETENEEIRALNEAKGRILDGVIEDLAGRVREAEGA